MSRTKKGSKSPGYDYWSKRPHSGLGYGKDARKRTNRTERQQAKKPQCSCSGFELGDIYCPIHGRFNDT